MKQSKSIINFSFLFLSLFLFLTTLNYSQPKNEGNFRNPELVELKKLEPTIRLDIKYATNNNFVGKPVYTQA